MSTAVSIVRTLLGLLFDHTIGNIVRMVPIIRLPKLERGPVSRGFLALLLVILFFGLTMLFSVNCTVSLNRRSLLQLWGCSLCGSCPTSTTAHCV